MESASAHRLPHSAEFSPELLSLWERTFRPHRLTSVQSTNSDLRVLVFAPVGRDGAAVAEILRRSGREVSICADLLQLVVEIEAGAGAVFVAEEGLFGKD